MGLRRIYTNKTICQIFKEVDGEQFAIVYTPNEYFICFAEKDEINKAIDVAKKEIEDFIDGKITEREYQELINERQEIMRGIIQNKNIPLNGDLYNTLFVYFGKAEQGYMLI